MFKSLWDAGSILEHQFYTILFPQTKIYKLEKDAIYLFILKNCIRIDTGTFK